MAHDPTGQDPSRRAGAGGVTAPAGVLAFLKLWDQLFSIGPLYPAGNARFLAVAREWGGLLAGILGNDPVLRIDMGREAIMIQGRALGRAESGSRQLADILDSLGIFRLEIERTISSADLHQLATKLLRLKKNVEVARGFRQIEFPDLPESVHIYQREFGKMPGIGTGWSTLTDLAAKSVDRTLQSLNTSSLNEETQEACRDLIEKVFNEITGRFSVDFNPHLGAQEGFGRSLEDVLKIGAQAIQFGLTESFSAGKMGGNLINVFEIAEQAVSLSNDEDSVQMIVEILQDARKGAQDKQAQLSREANASNKSEFLFSIDGLNDELDRYANLAEPVQSLASLDRAEELSILLQNALTESGPELQGRINLQLSECLTQELSMRDSQVLFTALVDLVAAGDRAGVDRLLPLVLLPLRQAHPDSLTKLFQEICQQATVAELEAVWPHLVNEILMGSLKADAKSLKELHGQAAKLSGEAMLHNIPRLDQLQAMQEGLFSIALLEPLALELNPVFAALLSSSRADHIGNFLRRGLREHPPPWLIPGILDFIGEYSPQHKRFYILILNAGTDNDARVDLDRQTVKISLKILDRLPRAQMQEDWIPRAIANFGELNVAESRDLLSRISREKKWRLFLVWPPRCRQAAERALLALDRHAAELQAQEQGEEDHEL